MAVKPKLKFMIITHRSLTKLVKIYTYLLKIAHHTKILVWQVTT